jgi:hypothetical protein
LAKVVLIFEDIVAPGDPTQVGVRLSIDTDRSGDTGQLVSVPATPAMLFGLTVKRTYEQHVLENLIGFVCQDVMRAAGLTPPQMVEAAEKARVNSLDGEC